MAAFAPLQPASAPCPRFVQETPMPYMLLIMEPPGQRAERGLAGGQEAYARMLRFGDGLKARGLLLATESLASTEQAVRLQMREGQARMVDGPFAETKEMVGGFFLVDCATRDEAVALARECPAAEWATVEVREVAPCYQGA